MAPPGRIFGVDVGFTTGSAIVWGVFTDTSRFAGMLTGTYVGATAQATAVAGVGANALVGGSNHSVALQPLSVQGQVGLNAAGWYRCARPALRALSVEPGVLGWLSGKKADREV
jgi:hypothetical protein